LELRHLTEWREKTLLLINALKAQREETDSNELDSLSKFIDMYNNLEGVINSYQRLTDLGYFNNFVSKWDIM
jgi:hypothetical protein